MLLSFLLFSQSSSLILQLSSHISTSPSLSSLNFHPNDLISTSISTFLNIRYTTQVIIGTPEQSFNLMLDTGSSYTWVSSTSSYNPEEAFFNSSTSTSYENLQSKIVIEYSKGEVSGVLSRESMKIGTAKIVQQHFVLANEFKDFEGASDSGLLGLAFNSLSDGYGTIIENLKTQGIVEKAVFSVFISLGNSENLASVLTVGEYDIDKYACGEGLVIDVDKKNGLWQFDIESVGVGKEEILSLTFAFVDLGASTINGPENEVNEIKNMIMREVSGCYDYGIVVCDCEEGNYASFPDIFFKIQGRYFPIKAKNYIYYYNGYCIIEILSSKINYWVLGQSFYREYYIIHDMSKPSLMLYTAFGSAFCNENMQSISSSVFLKSFITYGSFAAICSIIVIFSLRYRKESSYYTKL